MKKIKKKIVKNKVEEVIASKSVENKGLSQQTKTQIIIGLAILVLIAIIVSSFLKFGVAAMVNGKMITKMAYIAKLQKQDRKTVLNQMVQESIIRQEAAKKGITVDQKDIDADMSKLEEELKKQGRTLDEALKAEGFSKEDIVGQIRDQKYLEALAKNATSTAEITQEQIDKFLTDNKAYLPKGKTNDELKQMAKEQLESQALNMAINEWLQKAMSEAKIIYR